MSMAINGYMELRETEKTLYILYIQISCNSCFHLVHLNCACIRDFVTEGGKKISDHIRSKGKMQ